MKRSLRKTLKDLVAAGIISEYGENKDGIHITKTSLSKRGLISASIWITKDQYTYYRGGAANLIIEIAFNLKNKMIKEGGL